MQFSLKDIQCAVKKKKVSLNCLKPLKIPRIKFKPLVDSKFVTLPHPKMKSNIPGRQLLVMKTCAIMYTYPLQIYYHNCLLCMVSSVRSTERNAIAV